MNPLLLDTNCDRRRCNLRLGVSQAFLLSATRRRLCVNNYGSNYLQQTFTSKNGEKILLKCKKVWLYGLKFPNAFWENSVIPIQCNFETWCQRIIWLFMILFDSANPTPAQPLYIQYNCHFFSTDKICG